MSYHCARHVGQVKDAAGKKHLERPTFERKRDWKLSLLFFLSFFFWLENDSKGIFDGFGSKIVSAIVFGDVKKIRVSVCV